jgi:hypothetical protein
VHAGFNEREGGFEVEKHSKRGAHIQTSGHVTTRHLAYEVLAVVDYEEY